ncbi:Ig-like domain-containing protein [Methanothermobacter sp.]|uniref:Ig-like domain-containing protein n=1 Tax=Methanothermobacter sp. TaxID=1884223 RepID=UPI003C78B91B
MKHIWKLLIIVMVFGLMGSSQAVHLGNRTYGYVEKDYYGNLNSNETIAVIIGVHPQESGIHSAVREKIRTSNLTRRYVLYSVHVTRDLEDYSRSRMNGQLLARDFIVPDIKNEKPMLVIDCHENHHHESGYAYSRFLYVISQNRATMNYAGQITSKTDFLRIYTPPKATSPEYVTGPIASQGYSTIIYETYRYDSQTKKLKDAGTIISALDSLKIYIPRPVNVTSSSPTAGAVTSRMPVIRVTFSESILPGRYWSSVTLRNRWGKSVRIRKWVSGNTIYVKPVYRLSRSSWYTITIPAGALLDAPQNRWTLKFRTGRR